MIRALRFFSIIGLVALLCSEVLETGFRDTSDGCESTDEAIVAVIISGRVDSGSAMSASEEKLVTESSENSEKSEV